MFITCEKYVVDLYLISITFYFPDVTSTQTSFFETSQICGKLFHASWIKPWNLFFLIRFYHFEANYISSKINCNVGLIN